MSSSVMSKDGTRIAYDRLGSGPAVILVGGAFQHRAFDPQTREMAGLLAERFTVVNFDRRGRGESGDTLPYAVEREVEDIDALIGEVGGSAFVFGHSSGAGLALEAVASGLAITKLAVYEPPFVVDDTRAQIPAALAKSLDELISAGLRSDAVELFMTGAVGVPPELIPQMRTTPMWAGFEEVAHTLAYDVTVMGDYQVPAARVAAFDIPTLVADGGESPDWMRNAAAALAAALPGAKRRTLEGQSHGVAPEVLAPLLAEFFAG
ncbi:alpha/beta fold hydrolase [Sphaerisporangium fuscum]|uniref:alpha/beta fold hydrolase n=1 Tax=Sphaerisporangium fuscum TaxID=2835868 RepID=UPI001BDD334E|nr:alpha/beta hydrolase [Sphaerisporangium fuscum]